MIHRIALVTLRAVAHLPPGRLAALSKPAAQAGWPLKQPSFCFWTWSIARLTPLARRLANSGGAR